MHEMVRRAVLTEKTKERFYGKPFNWGGTDCAKLAAIHARQFGWKVPRPGGYETLSGAVERLKELGCADLPELVCKTGLTEITPAMAKTGDIVSFAGEEAVGALGVAIGNGNMIAFHEAAVGAAIVEMGQIDRAWDIWSGK